MRVFNFSAGPAVMPLPVLERVQTELLDYHGQGMGLMEMSHRSKTFDEILFNAETRARELMGLGDEFAVLFLQGGASHQFAMVPLNFCRPGHPVNVIHTGHWTQRAIDEVRRIGELQIIASGESEKFRKLPTVSEDLIQANAAYLHYCSNNTIYGTQWRKLTTRPGVPTVIDMSSDFLSRPFPYSNYDLMYAGAQKNLGPSGLCFVAIRREFAARARKDLPEFFQYEAHMQAGSRLNTPPTFAIYMAGLVLEWIQKQGGLSALGKLNSEKAARLYDYIDQSKIYRCPVEKPDRSQMNVIFRISDGDKRLEDQFTVEAEKNRLSGLKGHRLTGGLRASLYNAQTLEAVDALIQFMKRFESEHA